MHTLKDNILLVVGTVRYLSYSFSAYHSTPESRAQETKAPAYTPGYCAGYNPLVLFTPMLEVKVHARKGRGLYTSRLIDGGETVLTEEPILLVPAPELLDSICCNCLRLVTSAGVAGVSSWE